jgi:hypothetical protein
MSCFSCGLSFNADVNSILTAYKELFLTKGVITYYYKLETNGDIKTCNKESFKHIYEREIKDNMDKGAEYACISEY